jgi:hypothetical protein
MSNIPLPFRIYLDRLKPLGSAVEEFDETVPPEFIGVDDRELRFEAPVHFSGKAYLAGKNCIIQVSVETEASQPCPICGAWGRTPIQLRQVTIPVEEEHIHGGVLDLRGPLREEIVMAVPQFVECRPEGCPERAEIARYLKQPEE